MRRLLLCIVASSLSIVSAQAGPAPLRVTCAEAAWCGIAAHIGGGEIVTDSILSSAKIDPHDLQMTPGTARRLAEADVVVRTGAHYDDWVTPLLDAEKHDGQTVLDIGTLAGWSPPDNPHLFDSLPAVRNYADALATLLIARRPEARAAIEARHTAFAHSLDSIAARIAHLRSRVAGERIAISEPIGGPLFDALGLKVVDPDLALAVMNHAEPPARDVAMLEEALQTRAVRMFVVNPVVSSPAVDRLTHVAQNAGIPTVPLTEMPTSDLAWQDWMTARIDRIEGALAP